MTVPAVQCLVCGLEGHLPSSCPEEQLPPLTQLPQLTNLYLRLIDSVCDHVARDWEPQEPELRDRDYIMNDLNRYIKKFWPKSELTLFGSSSNGFARVEGESSGADADEDMNQCYGGSGDGW